MSSMEPFARLEGDVADLERMIPDIEGAAVQEEALEIIGRLRTVLTTLETALAVVLPDDVEDLIDDPDALLRRVRRRLGDDTASMPPGPR